MIDACSMADANTDVDFSKYDYNGDGYVDFIFVVYAGYGQSQGGSEETVWPQAVDLTYESWNMYDGLYLGQAACSCELRGMKEQLSTASAHSAMSSATSSDCLTYTTLHIQECKACLHGT